MFSPSPMEVLIVLAVVLLLFGKRLPGVMHSVGKSIVEFKKGVRGIEDEVDTATYNRDSYKEASRPIPAEERQEMTAPKFEPPTSEPKPAETNQA